MKRNNPIYGQGFNKFQDEEIVTKDPNYERYREQINYSRKGSSGFKRNDEKVYEDVCDVLANDSGIDARNIEVQVKNSLVTLTGMVSTNEEKMEAQRAVAKVYGVDIIKNDLKISEDFFSDDFYT